MQQLHWTASGRGLPPGQQNPQQPPAQANPIVVPASGAPVVHTNPIGNNALYASRFTSIQAPQSSPASQQPTQQQQQQQGQQGQQQQQQQRAVHPPVNSGSSAAAGVGYGRNVAEANPPLVGREAPAISGANSAAAHTSSTATGVFFSGTRTNFTDIGGAAAYGLGTGGLGSSNGPNVNSAVNLMGDANDEEVNQLLRELECSVDTPHASAVLRDAIDAIEARALANFDPLSRDTFLEQRIRDVLTELSRTTNEKSLLLAVSFIEALIPISYTSPQSKFTRLFRSLSVLRQSGNEKAARESQRVYKLLLEADAHYPGPDSPLKSFVPKELRESCEQALLQLHGRVQQSKVVFPAQFLSVMLSCAATAEVSPRYLSGSARAQAIQLSMTLAGSPDELLRKAAYECMVAIFRNTTSMRLNELVLENRRLCEECLRSLNASQHNERHIASALKALHALLSSRGLTSIDKQVLPQLCVLVTEQQRMAKSALVRAAVCDLVPIIASVDIASAPRRSTYCAIIMEPVKNVRDERFKGHELQNVASFLRNVGYRVFDQTNRTNLESILHRYISRPETQEACWSIMAAICASSVSTAGIGGPVTIPNPATLSRRSIHRSTVTSSHFAQVKASDSTSMAGTIVSPTTGVSRELPPSPSSADVEPISRNTSKDNIAGSSPRPQQQHGYQNGSEISCAKGSISSTGATTRRGRSTSNGMNNDGSEDGRVVGAAGDGDDISSMAMVSTTTALQSPNQSSFLTTPASPSAPVFNFGTTSAHLTLTIDDIVQRCLPYLSHAVLTQSLVDSLRIIQTSRPPLKAEVQAALDKLVDSVLKEPAGGATTTVTGGPASSNSQSHSHHGRDSEGSSTTFNCGNSSPLAATQSSRVPQHPLVSSEPSTVAARPGSNSSSIGTMGRLSQYFRPTDNATGVHRHEGNSTNLGSSATMASGAGVSKPGASASHGLTGAPGGSPGGFLGVDSSYAATGSGHMHEQYGSSTNMRYSPLSSSISAAFSPVSSTPTSQPAHVTLAAAPVVLKNDLTVALKAFSARPVTSVQHLDDLKNCVVGFQRHEDPQVRKQSSETIISSLRQWIAYAKEHKTSTYSTRVTEILEAYMKNVLLEMDRRCRLFEITLLANATSLRAFLSEQRILSSLLSFLNSTAQVREKTVELLVAVTQDSKPSPSVVAVQQSLYVTVESCVVILEFTNDVNMLLRSMADLQTFTRLCIRPLNNHLGRIFYAFRKRILESTVADVVLLSLLKTMETIIKALSREEKVVLQYQDDVLELYNPIVDILKQSPSPALSHAAINVLVHMNEMCLPSSSTDVWQQQELIGALIHVYTGSSCTVEESLSMLTLFGQLGAVDPSLNSSAVTVKKKEEVAVQDEADLELTFDYTVIVYRTLSRMLDASLSDAVCSQALRTLLQFIRSTQDKKDVVGGVHAVRAVLQITKRFTDSPVLRVEALHVLAAITAMRHERIARLMLPEIVVLLEQLWTPADRPLFRGVLEVVSALKPGKLSGKEQSESWAWLYPRLVDVALQDHTESREFCLRVVEIVLNASYIPPHCIPIVFPMLLQFIQQSDQLVDVRSQSLCAAVHIVCELKAVQFFSSLLNGIRTLTRHCELNEDLGPRLSTPGVRESLKVLAALHPSGRGTIKQLRDRIGEGEDRMSAAAGPALYTTMGMQVNSMASLVGANPSTSLLGALSGHGSSVASPFGVTSQPNSAASRSTSALGLGSLTGTAGGGSYLRRTVPETFPGAEEEDVSLSLGTDQSSGPATAGQEISLFMKHVDLGFRLKESKLREWFAELQKCIILVSPHPAFRMMVDLLDKHEPLCRELFLPSFKCLYESLTADQIKKLNEMLTIVLKCSDHELSSKCLSLADYLDHNEPNLKPEVLDMVRSMRRADHHRMSHQSEPESLLVRSTPSSNTNALSLRGRGSTQIIPQHQLYPSAAEVSMNQMAATKTRGRKAAFPRGGAGAASSNTQPLAIPAGLNTNKGRSIGTNRNGDPNQDNLDTYAFSEHGGSSAKAPTVGQRKIPSVAAGGGGGGVEERVVGDDDADSDNCSPMDTLDSTISDNKIGEGSPIRPKEAPSDVCGVPGLQAAGSYRPLVSSVVRKPMSNHAYTLSHGSSSSSSSSNELSEDSHDLDLQPKGSHIPAQPNMLFSTEDIVRAAEHTRMYDKALSYLENRLLAMLNVYRYTKMPRDVIHKTVWPLAWLYSQREMQDSVVGLFRAIRYEGGEDQAGFGYELLRWWSKAQQTYAKSITAPALRDMSVPPHILEGYVRTLTLCGEWNRAYDVAMQVSSRREAYVSSTVARCGATAAWLLGRWDDVQYLAERLSVSERHTTALRLFFLNGVALKNAITEHSASAYESLRHMITQSKLVIDESLRTLLPLSYTHAYENVTMLQHFTEMEEMIDFCHCRSLKGRQQMYERWNNRFRCLNPDSLQPSLRSLMLHSLVLSTNEMADMILHFCETRQASYPELTEWAMSWLRHGSFSGSCSHATTPSASSPTSVDQAGFSIDANAAASLTPVDRNPNVAVGFIIHLWSRGKRQEAVEAMERFLRDCGKDLEENHASCYGNAQLRLGTWKQDLHTDSFWRRGFCEEELGHFHKAIRAMPSSYEAWHSWGLMNYRIQQRDHNLSPEDQRNFVEAAHQGFVGAICRCKDSSEALPAVMRLLQLWVIHNGVGLLKETVADGISRIPIDHWVQAIPQLIGHLGNDNHDIREVICMILRSLCEVHPQATVFPLLVVMMSDSNGSPTVTNDSNLSPIPSSSERPPFNMHSCPRTGSASAMHSKTPMMRKQEIVQSIIQHCPKRIFHEAEAVAKLLVDVSAIPIEKIRENLSQVAAAWNPNAEYEEDPEEVYHRLQSTMEIFHANRRHLLFTVGDIGQFVQMVMADDRSGQREKAAGVVNQLVEEISKHVAEKLGREPQKAMEPLLHLRNLSVAVFGEYDIHKRDSYPTIASFSSKLDVIPSKKRPRRIQLNGSDGCLYIYCLKGNEDIRMDERVMQLFGMVNVLLSHTRIPTSAYIHRFPVIPISSNVGLLGWVENANTINNTICNYRTTISNVRTHQESSALRSYVESFGNWDKLSIIQRTEVLDFVMNSEHCEAVDVSRAMWHRANAAEQWLDRRTAFTVSLATMSMVGYIMGLGDRHLGNILISMSTGKVVHIDFGDSFDVGRLRHVLPETIPFRLTRMLTNAMEVFGVDGIFRAFATRTQTALHKNRDSIMALLSAFVYDPIVQYKGKMKNVMEKSRSPQDIAERIRNKLRGMEMAVNRNEVNIFNTTQDSCRRPDLLYMSTAFDDPAVRHQTLAMSSEEQVSFLIDEATRIDNYTTLYFGWGPLW
ncbi:putative phosphatidylinositol 3-kinase [Leptomonas seymouri]|uniref:non-specific serine/threonine protein kinase n=1 Tax=Leptomonas seymouri TaxID=5684 RepID=A0A0N1HZT8_LEPSE|nr:putative phosphatidylinositol 3-kinase [Leptomonas seymouri]|eukprot:KPI88823.1 putative phosphatidylinositol 3-kinase [Leptomonas seymouri]